MRLKRKLGRFEIAQQGTLFLDEIGELSLTTQAKILRFLEEREFNRVGGSKTIKVDVRLITATNKDLTSISRRKVFVRTSIIELMSFRFVIPPLRERKEDIPILIDHFVKKFNKENNKSVKGVSKEGLDLMMNYDWPGNVGNWKI